MQDFILDCVAVVGKFDPQMVHKVSYELHIPKGFMFMSSFGQDFPYSFTEMGGLRLITDNSARWEPTAKVRIVFESLQRPYGSSYQALISHLQLVSMLFIYAGQTSLGSFTADANERKS